jgi:uncharacterized protein GlcG (DUF336 family)
MILGAASLLVSLSVEAQVAESGYTLPLSLAIEAATEAIRSCEAHGYAVSAAVVDTSGIVKVQAKGDTARSIRRTAAIARPTQSSPSGRSSTPIRPVKARRLPRIRREPARH